MITQKKAARPVTLRKRVFISYVHEDATSVVHLAEALTSAIQHRSADWAVIVSSWL